MTNWPRKQLVCPEAFCGPNVCLLRKFPSPQRLQPAGGGPTYEAQGQCSQHLQMLHGHRHIVSGQAAGHLGPDTLTHKRDCCGCSVCPRAHRQTSKTALESWVWLLEEALLQHSLHQHIHTHENSLPVGCATKGRLPSK